jgi:hypothetical protein
MILREIEGRERGRERSKKGGAEEACWQRGRGRNGSEKTGEAGRAGGGEEQTVETRRRMCETGGS